MWIIIKFNKKNISLMMEDLKKRIGPDINFYTPKIKLQFVKKKRILNKSKFMLNDYMFCFHERFNDKNFLPILNYVKGLKCFLPNFKEAQKDIKNFIFACKDNEDKDGFVTQNFFNYLNNFKNKKYKFQSGPFTNFIFKIIDIEKNLLNILIGKYSTTVKKNKYLFETV